MCRPEGVPVWRLFMKCLWPRRVTHWSNGQDAVADTGGHFSGPSHLEEQTTASRYKLHEERGRSDGGIPRSFLQEGLRIEPYGVLWRRMSGALGIQLQESSQSFLCQRERVCRPRWKVEHERCPAGRKM